MVTKNSNAKIGVVVLLFIFSLAFVLLFSTFFYIQFTGEASGEDLLAEVEELHTHEEVVPASRGTIYDQNGNPIASDSTSYTMYAVLSPKATPPGAEKPNHVVDEEKTATELSNYIDMSYEDIYKILSKKKDADGNDIYQVEFGRAGKELDITKKKQIEALELPGINFTSESKRFYSNGTFASHTIGYVEPQVNEETGEKENVGMMGLEQQFNDELTGTDGYIKYPKDKNGNILPNSEPIVTEPQDGLNLHTTIDKKIQIFLEDTMAKADNEFHPEEMIAIVADAKTGAILAMSQRPTFDLNTLEGIDQNWHNLAIENSFEPGSTFKMMTLGAAINEGVFNPNATFKSGTYQVADVTIHDHNKVGWGTISYLEGVQRSSNVAFAKLGMELIGPEILLEYINSFGYAEPTGIELPHEANSNIAFTYPSEKATTAFGQGTAVTSIQQIQAATAIANDGNMMQPYLIDKIENPNTGEVTTHEPVVVGQPITAETAKTEREYLATTVTSPVGTGKTFALDDGYTLAGKTGTAQIPNPNGSGYMTGAENYIFSFMGMAPAENPELVMYVAVKQPQLKGNQVGSEPVSMIFKSVMNKSLKYLNIDPGTDPEQVVLKMPDFVADQAASMSSFANTNSGLEVIELGSPDGKVIAQSPAPKEILQPQQRIFVVREGPVKMPDVIGWSSRDVMVFAQLFQMPVNFEGEGFVVSQSVPSGTEVAPGTALAFSLGPPT